MWGFLKQNLKKKLAFSNQNLNTFERVAKKQCPFQYDHFLVLFGSAIPVNLKMFDYMLDYV